VAHAFVDVVGPVVSKGLDKAVPAQITLDELRSGLGAELSSPGARLPGAPAAGGSYRLTARRRRSDAHRIIASILAVLALVGCVTAVLVLAVAPTASRMQNDIRSLNTRLDTADSRLASLQSKAVHAARQGSRLRKRVGLLDRHLTGLSRTVHGLQGATSATREQADALRACFAALQDELGSLSVSTRSVHGRVTDVGLRDAVGAPTSCGDALSTG
jgi:hypothetical protein